MPPSTSTPHAPTAAVHCSEARGRRACETRHGAMAPSRSVSVCRHVVRCPLSLQLPSLTAPMLPRPDAHLKVLLQHDVGLGSSSRGLGLACSVFSFSLILCPLILTDCRNFVRTRPPVSCANPGAMSEAKYGSIKPEPDAYEARQVPVVLSARGGCQACSTHGALRLPASSFSREPSSQKHSL